MSLNDLQGQAAGLHAKRPRVRESQTRHWSITHSCVAKRAGASAFLAEAVALRLNRTHCDAEPCAQESRFLRFQSF